MAICKAIKCKLTCLTPPGMGWLISLFIKLLIIWHWHLLLPCMTITLEWFLCATSYTLPCTIIQVCISCITYCVNFSEPLCGKDMGGNKCSGKLSYQSMPHITWRERRNWYGWSNASILCLVVYHSDMFGWDQSCCPGLESSSKIMYVAAICSKDVYIIYMFLHYVIKQFV